MKQQRVQIIRNNCNSLKLQYRYFVAQQLHTGARCMVKKRRIKYFSVFALREETKRYSSHLNCRTGTLFLIGWVPIKLPSEINYHQPLPTPTHSPTSFTYNATSQAVRSRPSSYPCVPLGVTFLEQLTKRDRIL